MDDLLQEFLTETAESMDTLDVELVRLEQNPNDPELLGNIFRHVCRGPSFSPGRWAGMSKHCVGGGLVRPVRGIG